MIEGLPDGAGVGVPASPSSGTFCVSVDALSAITRCPVLRPRVRGKKVTSKVHCAAGANEPGHWLEASLKVPRHAGEWT